MDRLDAVDGIIDEVRAERILRSGVHLARQAVDSGKSDGKKKEKKRGVALSLGPYGATMRPSTEYSAAYDRPHSTLSALRTWHATRLDVYSKDPQTWKDTDYVAFETMGRTDEIAAVRLAMEDIIGSGKEEKKVWISCVFDRDSCTLPSGESPEAALHAALGPVKGEDNRVKQAAKVWGVGINCTKVAKLPFLIGKWEKELKRMVKEAQSQEGLAEVEWPVLVLYPDGTKKGERYDTTAMKWVVDENAEGEEEKEWAEEVAGIAKRVKERVENGEVGWKAVVVGGCCRVGPEDIGKLKRKLDA